MQTPQTQDKASEEQQEDRRSRFAFNTANSTHTSTIGVAGGGSIRDISLPASLRERAASQPPRRLADALPTRLELAQRRYESPFGAPGTPPPSATANFAHRSPSRHASFAMNNQQQPSSATVGTFPSRVIPTRSLSFSTTTDLPSRMQSYVGDGFPSTFEEDDEDLDYTNELDTGAYEQNPSTQAMSMSFSGSRDAAYLRSLRASLLAEAEGSSRSRSQSLAAMNRRQAPAALNVSGLAAPSAGGVAQSWTDAISGIRGYPRNQPHSAGVNIPLHSSGRPSIGAVGGGSHSMSSNSMLYRNASGSEGPDLSNMSPFVRDVGQIVHDDNPAFRDLWVNAPGMNHFGLRDDGGGSGTTSRRHSVSVVQPRSRQASNAIMGFSAGMTLDPSIEDDLGSGVGGSSAVGRGWGGANGTAFGGHRSGREGGRSIITDDELAIDLNNLNLQLENQSRSAMPSYRQGDVSQPSSLPIFGNIQGSSRPFGGPTERGLTPTHPGDGQYTQYGGQMDGSSPSTQGASLHDRESPSFDHPGGRRPSVSPSRLNGRRVSVDPQDGAHNSTGLTSDFPQAAGAMGQYRSTAQTSHYGGPHGAAQAHQRAPRGPGPLSLMNIGAGSMRSPVSPTVGQPSLSPTVRQQRTFATGPGAVASISPSLPAGVTSSPYFAGASAPGRGSISGVQQQVPSIYGYPPISPSAPAGGGFGGTRTGASALQGASTDYVLFGGNVGPGQGSLMNINANHPTPMTAAPPTGLQDLGRGVPLHSISSTTPLFVVEFKAGRADLFFCADPSLAGEIQVGDLVIVEADRGRDLGTVTKAGLSGEEVEIFQRLQAQRHSMMMGEDPEGGNPVSPSKHVKEVMPKRLYTRASAQDIEMMAAKGQDEAKALQLCQNKVRAKKLPMEVVEAEYQWDRRKLTFYFVSDRRIDFRELVRELFRLYKTRIWMACLQGPPGSADS